MLFAGLLLGLRSRPDPARAVAAPLASREGAFLVQNLLLVGVIAVVFWGTILPLVSGMLGAERVVDGTYYERAAGPLFAALLALLAAGPLLPWRRPGPAVWKAMRVPIAAALAVLAALLIAGVRSPGALLAVSLAAGAIATIAGEYARVALTKPSAIVRRRRRYGAYLAHLGVLVIAIGIAASHFGQQRADVTLRPGQDVTVAGYTLTYTGSEQRQLPDHTELVAAIKLGDRTLEPSRATYAGLGGQALTHVAISTTPMADVYVVLAGTNTDGSASFTVFVNPLVTWIWAGGIVVIAGVVLGNVGESEPVAELARRRIPITLPA